MAWFDKIIIQGITYLTHDNEIQNLKTTANANKLLKVNNSSNEIVAIAETDLGVSTATQTALNEKMDKSKPVITVELADE